MDKRRGFLPEVLIIAFGFVIGSVVIALVSGGWGALPALEGWLSPVVSVKVPPQQIWRDVKRTCFVLRGTKLSAAVPLTYEFLAKSRLSTWVAVPVQLVGPDRVPLSNDRLEDHKVGAVWDRGYCFDSAAFPATDRLQVKGMATHDRHPFYDTQTSIPPFEVPPASSATQ